MLPEDNLGDFLQSLSFGKLVEIFAALKDTCQPKRQAYLEIPEVSPEKIAQPYRKAQFLAQKRMAAQIKKNGHVNAGPVEEPIPNSSKNAKLESKATVPKGKAAVKPKAKKPKKEQTKTAMKARKNPRKPCDGPMQAAMKKYVTEQKAQGSTHQEALKSWKSSSERAGIVASVDLQEAKRRRYL